MKIIGKFLFPIILLLQMQLISGQLSNLRFERLTIDDGLSQSWVRCAIQDSDGFMWFGTGGNGINKYDGNNFKVYRTDLKDNSSLSNNWINKLYIDKKNRLWVGTQQGLNLYDKENDKFLRFPYFQSEIISGFYETDDGRLYVITHTNIYEINFEKRTSISYCKNNVNCFPYSLRDCEKDKNGNLWVVSLNGVYVFDIINKEYKIFKHNPDNPKSIINNAIETIYKDSKDRIWLGSVGGLSLTNYNSSIDSLPQFINFKHDPKDPNSISAGNIYDILDDGNGYLWIAIVNAGLNILDLNSLESGKVIFKHIKSNVFDETSLSDNSINTIYKDKQGTIWLGTYSGGISYYNKYLYKFNHYKFIPESKNCLNNNVINTFFEDNDDLWIGTEGGLNILNKKTGKFRYYSYDPHNPKSISSNSVWSIFKDSRSNIWIGTWAGGLNLFNKSTETFTHFVSNSSNPNSINSDNVFAIAEDNKGYLWLATMGGGLNRYSYKTNIFKSYRVNYTSDNSISGDWIQYILETSDNELWIATTDGVDIFNHETEKFINFKHDTANSKSISYNGACVIFEDSKKNIWVGTDAGLNCFIRKDSSFIYYLEDDGLPGNSIKGICEDNKHNLWVSTNMGVSKFINGVNLPAKAEFKNFSKSDGLQENEFNRHSSLKGKDGYIYFGGNSGFNSFIPDSLTDNLYIPKVILTDLLIFNKPVEISTKGSPLITQINECSEIVLSYKDYIFTLKFAALNYIAPEKNQYAFMLEGFEKEWNYVGNKRDATYTNLDPGKYTFRVKASNNDGYWNDIGTSLDIIILPPWWKSIWFRIVVIVFVLSLFIGFYLIKVNSLKKQKIHLQKLVQERTIEIENNNKMLINQSLELNETNSLLEEKSQHIEGQNELLKEQAEKLNETNTLLEEKQQYIMEQAEELLATNDELQAMNATKDKFFAIIAHDLKNPFNAIMGFSELLSVNYNKYDDTKRTTLINTILDSSKKLYKLLENLLQWARSQTGSIDFNPEEFYIYELADSNAVLVENMLVEKNIKIVISDFKDIKVYADKNMISTVIRNLITNAIKFNENGTITVDCEQNNSLVTLKINDTGIGIPRDKLDSLFDVASSKSTQGTQGEDGTGLGLILCKEFITKNKGNIGVESEVGKGSTFYFTLPVESY